MMRILIISFITFVLGMALAPLIIRLLRKYKLGKQLRDAKDAPVFAALHASKAGTPTMGGIVIWATVIIISVTLWTKCQFIGGLSCDWNFLTRAQTLLPFGALIAAALVGLVDDYLNVRRIGPKGGGLRMRHRLISYTLIALGGAWWFYAKLGWDFLHIPFYGNFPVGILAIPAFTLIIVATSFSVNETDGLDGLAGGPLMTAFTAFSVISFIQGRVDLAVFCAAIVGALMAFLWFNVTPASFFMGDTGAMSLGTVLGVVAIFTNQPFLLLIIGLPFVIESLSVIIQITSKKIRKKKVFLSAPIHHHLEAIGWKESQIVFRTWIISFFCGSAGVIIALLDKLY
ncbi:phospho-N-acetylmuramoyl-pentapeptide-transferase [Candidatus Uhrbacteria bacterium]|nr:phospho-N-acetylmuramoyl-pentapeptide-transferase [Candidatus Uhrbacteria bacterium]